MYKTLEQYKDYLPTNTKQEIEYIVSELRSMPEEKQDIKYIQSHLSLLMCKVFFDYEGVDIPEHLAKKVEKIKNIKNIRLQ